MKWVIECVGEMYEDEHEVDEQINRPTVVAAAVLAYYLPYNFNALFLNALETEEFDTFVDDDELVYVLTMALSAVIEARSWFNKNHTTFKDKDFIKRAHDLFTDELRRLVIRNDDINMLKGLFLS